MLRKIDFVMLKVDKLEEAAAYYERVFGLKRLWSDAHSVAMVMPETDAEIVLHDNPDLPCDISVHYLVDAWSKPSPPSPSRAAPSTPHRLTSPSASAPC